MFSEYIKLSIHTIFFMLDILRFPFFLIDLDQKIVLNWFEFEKTEKNPILQAVIDGLDLGNSDSTSVSLETFRFILEGLWEKIQNGLTLGDIENVLFVILFFRFVILAIKYNLKTSFYITCIGLFAGYLWYRHLIDLILMYRNVLLKLPFLNSLGMDAVQMRVLNRQMALSELKLGENAHWYNPGQIILYAFKKGIIHKDPETGLRSYVDPISMGISKLQEPFQSKIYPLYYNLYNKIIPKIYTICSKFWNQLSGVAAYAVITRIGKRYCPYLVRWHWTFLLIIGLVEQIFIYFIYRVYYFQTYVLIPKVNDTYNNSPEPGILFQINGLNIVIATIVLAHIGFILFGLFHAIWGQYFYIPFFVENTELHIGPRPKDSVYSGGYTSWQDPEEKNVNRLFPKLWFGWFGTGTKNSPVIISSIINLLKFLRHLTKKLLRKLKNQFNK